MCTVFDVADYFLAQQSVECGDTISNLKLQKLVYYSQGFSLASLNAPLFTEQIQAWEHGPVVPCLWRKYKSFGAGSIPKPQPGEVNFDVFSKDQKDLLGEVWKVLGQFSAWKLRNMTHIEPPWKDTPRNAIIKRKCMKAYFKTRLN